MNAGTLKPNPGARRAKLRVCRGGKMGKTGGRGYNGQNSRSGGTKGPGFEGGQTPWHRRLPKFRGFKNPFRTEYQEVSLSDLEVFEAQSVVDAVALRDKGVVKNIRLPIKVLGNGTLSKSLKVYLDAYSESAKAAIVGAGGTTEVI